MIFDKDLLFTKNHVFSLKNENLEELHLKYCACALEHVCGFFCYFFFLRLTDSEKILLSYHFFVGIAFYERKIINSTELEPLRQNLFRQKTWNQLVKNFEFESKDYFKALS